MRTVLITGSSRGIGLATAKRFALDGSWNIVITCSSSADALHQAAAQLESSGNNHILTSIGDISDPAYVAALFEDIRHTFGRIDVLINNAGVDYFGLLQDMSVEDWNRIMNVNLRSVFLTTKYAIPMMLQTGSGSIVNLSSIWGTAGGSCEAAYSASKGGIIAFTKAMAQELAPSHIRVNAVAPGAIDTAMNSRLSEEEKAELASDIPLGRMGRSEEVAELIYDCAVSYSYLTGQTITLDGGWT